MNKLNSANGCFLSASGNPLGGWPFWLGPRGLSTETVHMVSCAFSALGCFFVGGLVGLFAWGGGSEVWRLAWLLVLPSAFGLARSRLAGSTLMLGYLLSAARALPGGSEVFFGGSAPWWLGWLFWVVVSLVLTLPFSLLWADKLSTRAWRFALAVCLSVVPPLAIIGWTSPLTVAGLIFPQLGWVGLVLALAVMAALVSRCRQALVVLAVIAIAANSMALFVGGTKVPAGWIGVNTSFARLSSAAADDDVEQLLASLKHVGWVKEFALSVPPNSVRVLPEIVLGTFGGVSNKAKVQVADRRAALNSAKERLVAKGRWNAAMASDEGYIWAQIQQDMVDNKKYGLLFSIPFVDCTPGYLRYSNGSD